MGPAAVTVAIIDLDECTRGVRAQKPHWSLRLGSPGLLQNVEIDADPSAFITREHDPPVPEQSPPHANELDKSVASFSNPALRVTVLPAGKCAEQAPWGVDTLAPNVQLIPGGLLVTPNPICTSVM